MTKVIGDYTAAAAIDGSTNYLLIQPGNASTAYNKINRNVFLGVTGQPVDISSTQTLTNKVLDNTNTITLKDTLFTLQDDSDTTKQAKFQLSGITTATTRTYTLPNTSSTLVDLSSSQTLTSKTLTAPVITGGSIDTTTVTVDAISGHTSANNGTVYGITVTSGTIGTSGIANGAVTPNKLATGGLVAGVITSETTASTSYTDLTTTTDTVTITVGNNRLALVSVTATLSNGTSSAVTYVSSDISGANTSAAADNRALSFNVTSGTGSFSGSWCKLISLSNTGSTTFKMKYRVSAGTGTFSNRSISVVPL